MFDKIVLGVAGVSLVGALWMLLVAPVTDWWENKISP